MSTSQKVLKILSIVIIVFAVIVIAFGVAVFTVGVGWRSSVSDPYGVIGGWAMIFGGFAIVLGALALIAGIFYLIFGILGVRGANNPSKIGPFYVISIIILALIILGILTSASISTSVSAVNLGAGLLASVPMIACVYLAHDIKQIRDGRK